MKRKIITSMMIFGISSSLYADEFGLELGAQRIEVGGSVQYKGTKIDLKNDLKLDDTKTSIKPTLTYTTDSKKHKFFLNYEKSNYDKSSVITRSITFNNKVYTIGANVNTKLKTQWYQLGYRYNFEPLADNKLNIDAGIDLNIIDLQTSLVTTGINESYDVTAPLPTLALDLKYDIVDDFALEVKGAFMTLGSYGDYSEYYAGLNVGIPSVKNLSLKAGYMSKNLNIESDSNEKLELDYSGAYVGLAYKF
ncbi:hypothetical protein [Arcobacter sp.]|uniref:hypothetical protein n=1 Tax=Arcobacter sp. TaxID=1872629 RepID=UPI003D0A09C9